MPVIRAARSRVAGPKSVKLGTTIHLKASGYSGQAVSVRVFLNVKGVCAKTAKAQKGTKLTFGPYPKNKSFKLSLPPLTPGNPPTTIGKHTLCAFLIGPPAAEKSYAHTSFSYKVHS